MFIFFVKLIQKLLKKESQSDCWTKWLSFLHFILTKLMVFFTFALYIRIILKTNQYILTSWRQDYISLVNPSPSCLHKSRVRARAYTVGQRWKGDRAHAKIHCIFSHLLFWDREGLRRLSPIPSIPKNLQSLILITP